MSSKIIRTRAIFTDGIVSEGAFNTMEELSSFISSWGDHIITLEVDVESSDNNRPAFWSEE
jgi:hypothetical protein